MRLSAAASDRLVRPLRLIQSPLYLLRLSAAASDSLVRPLRKRRPLCLLRLSAARSDRVCDHWAEHRFTIENPIRVMPS